MTKRELGVGPESDYYYDHVPYYYNKFKSTREYISDRHESKFVVDTRDLGTYEFMFLKFRPTPHDPTRKRAYGTRMRRKTTTILTVQPLPTMPSSSSSDSSS